MSIERFCQSIKHDETPPAGYGELLEALWWDGKGDWVKAHSIVQSEEGVWATRIHAYLHRKEGDQSNAAYWYRRSQMEPPKTLSLDDEWHLLVGEIIENHFTDF